MSRREKTEADPSGNTCDYSLEILDGYRKSPAEWKLNWLEEVNRLTFQVLDEKHIALRKKIRQGKIA
jgi:hypothetical protein